MTNIRIPDRAFDDTIAVLGRIGSGKTYTAKGQVELILERGERVCIIDPTGVWWGLRSSADGKSAGYPVAVFGGEHADVAIVEDSAEPLAQLVVDRNLPVIVDVSAMSGAARTRFMTRFLGKLYMLNREPLTLVVDETDLFAPQRPLPGQEMLQHQMEQIVRRGRSRGFRTWMISQRPAEVHKSVLSQAGTLVAMRITSPQDRAAIGDWIKGQADVEVGKAVLAALPKMAIGTGYVWCPAVDFLESIAFPTITTFDSSRTPARGEKITPPSKLADVDLGGVLDALKPPAEPEKKGAKSPADPAALTEAEARGYQRRFDEGVLAGRDAMRREIAIEREKVQEILDALFSSTGSVCAATSVPVAPAERKPKPPSTESAPPKGSPVQRILNAIGWWSAAGVSTPTRHQVAFVAGYRVGGNFNNVVGSLRTAGQITYPGDGTVRLTDEGTRAAAIPSRSPTRAELIDRVRSVLRGEPQRRLFDALCSARKRITREDLATATGYSVGGNFNNLVGALRTLGVADYPSPGTIGLSRIFEGLS